MISSAAVYIIFRIANFAVLILVFVYLFWRFGLAMVKGQMRVQQQEHEALLCKKKTLELEVQQQEEALQEQALLCQHLDKAVARWKKQVAFEKQAIIGEQKSRDEALVLRAARQQKEFEAYYFSEHIVPDAITRAEGELSRLYADKKAGEQFIDNLIEQMKKS